MCIMCDVRFFCGSATSPRESKTGKEVCHIALHHIISHWTVTCHFILYLMKSSLTEDLKSNRMSKLQQCCWNQATEAENNTTACVTVVKTAHLRAWTTGHFLGPLPSPPSTRIQTHSDALRWKGQTAGRETFTHVWAEVETRCIAPRWHFCKLQGRSAGWK